MRTCKYYLPVGLLILASVAVGQEQISNIADRKAFKLANPMAIPTGAIWDYSSLTSPGSGHVFFDSSKVHPESRDGSLLMVPDYNGAISVYRLANKAFLGIIPISSTNPMNAANGARWGQGSEIIFAAGVKSQGGSFVKKQTWNQPATATNLIELPMTAIANGADFDMDGAGQFYPVMMASSYDGSNYTGVETAVADVLNKKLSVRIPGKPDSIDISPDGKWFVWLNHEALQPEEPNRFYRITDLFNGAVAPVYLDSAITQGTYYGTTGPFKSVGHNGWAYLADGTLVFVYQDNRGDVEAGNKEHYKYFNPETGKSIKFYRYADAGYPNVHFSRNAPRGYALASTYGSASPNPLSKSVMLIELSTGAITEICKTRTSTSSKITEAAASVDRLGKWAFWGWNLDGTKPAEAVRVALPSMATPTPTPTPTATPTPSLTPTPEPTPKPKKVKFRIPAFEFEGEIVE